MSNAPCPLPRIKRTTGESGRMVPLRAGPHWQKGSVSYRAWRGAGGGGQRNTRGDVIRWRQEDTFQELVEDTAGRRHWGLTPSQALSCPLTVASRSQELPYPRRFAPIFRIRPAIGISVPGLWEEKGEPDPTPDSSPDWWGVASWERGAAGVLAPACPRDKKVLRAPNRALNCALKLCRLKNHPPDPGPRLCPLGEMRFASRELNVKESTGAFSAPQYVTRFVRWPPGRAPATYLCAPGCGHPCVLDTHDRAARANLGPRAQMSPRLAEITSVALLL